MRMKINDWSEVNTLMDFDSAHVSDVEVLMSIDGGQLSLMLLKSHCLFSLSLMLSSVV